MDNAVDALKMGFAVIAFVIALTVSIVAMAQAKETSEKVFYMTDKTNFYEYLSDKKLPDGRIVSGETIIPTLYRYYKENFSVKLYDEDKLVQIFDLNTERNVSKAAALRPAARNDEQRTLLAIYGDKTAEASTNPYLFEAPWMGNATVDTKTRVDLYVNGECGYINNIFVDYTSNNLKRLIDKKNSSSEYEFVESFVKYTYSGDTISVGEGEGIETITGSKQPEDKIEITYTLKKVN